METYKGKFYRLIHPRPTIILGTICPNGRVNLMPASWNMPSSEEPPTIAVSVYRETYTYECLKYHGEATINVPGVDMLDLTYMLGSCSGRDVDKVKEFKVELIESEKIKPPGIKNSLAIYEGKVIGTLPAGECDIFLFEILNVKVKEGVADEYGLKIGDNVNLLLHGSGRVFYLVYYKKYFAKKK
jgi:flavin reductase (DIM6/NTAB) family NADH-FMN oxidoreductase RutF